MLLRRLFALISGFAVLAAVAQEKTETSPAPGEPKSFAEAIQQAGVKLVTGPATVPLGHVAEMKIGAGFHFVGADQLELFYNLTQNSRSGNEVGVLLSPENWMLFFAYDDIGYVKDEDKDELKPDKLMEAMTAGQDDDNRARQERGWDAMKVAGWATPPHYDEKTNNLKWAINLTSSRDNFQEVWINESIRLLGRGGVMSATLVTDPAQFKEHELAVDRLLATDFTYVAGEKYAEFKSGDKIAEYGLAALVLGGAGAVAMKTGLLAGLLSFVGKMWKAVVFAVVALGAGIAKIWNKITGAKGGPPPEQPS